ncbi:hypothetical protein OG508_28180 [Streptomyces sp. NBC_01108]|uniref:hypothetical protein n=1 Tax=Streptomyces sp. NBC_01108 TaxID=2903751 RepID=UPI003872FCC8|nr:hypothetical protein OG508_28180 [Streptomyces sp. NBC_01108]
MSDREQLLLHLVDRARRGVALPAELDALADGITAMADRVDAADQEVTEMATAAAHLTTLVGKRAEQAEAALERVKAALDDGERIGWSRPHLERQLRAALDQPQQPTT